MFALLMDDYIEKEGQRLREENERLKNDPAAAVPEDVRQRCIKTIRRECARKDRRTAGRVTLRVLNGIAVAVAICTLLFTTAFAVSPEFRATTLNLLMEVSSRYTTLRMSEDSGEQPTADENSSTTDSDQLLFGYRLPEIPDGFVVDYTDSSSAHSVIQYVNTNNEHSVIFFCINKYAGDGSMIVDTEDSQAEHILIHGYEGLLVEKQREFEDYDIHEIHIVWGDTQQDTYIDVVCTELGREFALELAAAFEFVGENS